VAIHRERINEPYSRTHLSGPDGLPRRSRWSLLAMTECIVIAVFHLFVVRPHPQDENGFFGFHHFVHQAVLDIDPA